MIPVACFVRSSSSPIKSSRIVSAPGAHIRVTEYELTESAKEGLRVPAGAFDAPPALATPWHLWPAIVVLAGVAITMCHVFGVHFWLMDKTPSDLPLYGGRARRERCISCNCLKVKP